MTKTFYLGLCTPIILTYLPTYLPTYLHMCFYAYINTCIITARNLSYSFSLSFIIFPTQNNKPTTVIIFSISYPLYSYILQCLIIDISLCSSLSYFILYKVVGFLVLLCLAHDTPSYKQSFILFGGGSVTPRERVNRPYL